MIMIIDISVLLQHWIIIIHFNTVLGNFSRLKKNIKFKRFPWLVMHCQRFSTCCSIPPLSSATLGKLLTHMCLCHQAV